MEYKLLSEHVLGDMSFRYVIDANNHTVSLLLIPAHLTDKIVHKQYELDSLLQLKIVGDDYPSYFSHGRSMRNASSSLMLSYVSQEMIREDHQQCIITTFHHPNNLHCTHTVSWKPGDTAVEMYSSVHNNNTEAMRIEMLSSFSIAGVTPFEEGDTPNTLLLHRIRSNWSAEGRLETVPIEELHLEPSWITVSANSIRYGQVGTMPVRGFAPFFAIEDTKHNVIWAAQLAYAGSWQMELYRKDSALHVSGGLADREFGHWMKTIASGELFCTPPALVTVVEGSIDDATNRLTSRHLQRIKSLPKIEENLPIVFNEFCTTWGDPDVHSIHKIAQKLHGKGIDYLVIDAGWYANEGEAWDHAIGDWSVAAHRFPKGLKHTADLIRENGMIPGIWFEFEVCTINSTAFHRVDHLLKRDGIPITSGKRRFWDMNDPYVIEYLSDKLIKLLRDNNIGYLKIDYNDNIGIGCDHEDSLGEGLRRQVKGIRQFIQKISAEVPNIVIENCSSGGHRLEPSMLEITSMSSFSDAHACLETPIVAANLHRCIHPRQSQIWAVLRKEDSFSKLIYTISSAFLGRMCLSGDIHELSDNQWRIVDEGIRFYKTITSILKDGSSYRLGPPIKSYRHPIGWQGILRTSSSMREAVIVLHTFAGEPEQQISIPLPANKEYRMERIYADREEEVQLANGILNWRPSSVFQAVSIYLVSGHSTQPYNS